MFEEKKKLQGPLLALQLFSLVVLVALLTIHVRSVRVFRWEQSVSGGLLVTYSLAVLGLALETGLKLGGTKAFKIYICGSGGLLLAINAGMIYYRWRRAGELTRVVAELLGALGLPLRRQILIKVSLSAAAAVALLIDLVVTILSMD